jgi:hypothetical protein
MALRFYWDENIGFPQAHFPGEIHSKFFAPSREKREAKYFIINQEGFWPKNIFYRLHCQQYVFSFLKLKLLQISVKSLSEQKII